MAIFYATLVSTYISYFLARIAYDKKIKSLATFWSVVIFIILALVSGGRGDIGDTGAYKHSYTILASNPNLFKFEGDFGFGLLSLALIQVSTDPQILIFITALITNLFNTITFNKYRSYLELQVYLYITSGYYTVTMNGIRQCLVASILFACTNMIIEGKFKKYLIVVLLVSTIHKSALILIPVYYIVRQEAWSKQIVKLIILSIIGVIFYNKLEPILFKLIGNTQYGHYSEYNGGGASIIRTIVNAVPVALAYLKRSELKEKWDNSDIFINISILNLVFVALGMYQWIFNRFTIYFQLYNFILLPYIIKNCFKGKEKRLLYVGLIICYFIFFYREQVIGFNMNYNSKYLDFEKLFYYIK